MKENNQKNLIWWIIGGIVFLALGSFIIYKLVQGNKNKESTPAEPKKPVKINENQPSQTSPPATNLPTPSKEIELEKYLLEKRLDLKKYFVFNLKELRLTSEKPPTYKNWRWTSGILMKDLTKIAADHEKIMKEKGYKFNEGKLSKELVVFLGNSFNSIAGEEWAGQNLDQKIAKGENYYIIFEKHEDEPNNYFGSEVDESGEIHFFWTNLFSLRIKVPSTHLFENKKEVLDFLKKNDPALIGWAN